MGGITEAETLAMLKVWGEWWISGCGRLDAVYSARAASARRWAWRVESVLPLVEAPLRVVLRQTFVEGLSIEAARQDVRTRWSARRYSQERRRAVAMMGKLLGRTMKGARPGLPGTPHQGAASATSTKPRPA
jgi:hypothetical protein